MVLRVTPEDPSRADELAERIRQLNPNSVDIEDIGFGIKVLKVSFIIDDREGDPSSIEEKLRNLDGVSEIDTLSVDLIS